jgi:hypothetical protein
LPDDRLPDDGCRPHLRDHELAWQLVAACI